MKHLLEVCLISVTLTTSGAPIATAQSSSSDAVPVLRKGISVELPSTTSAVSVPEADKEDALVVTIRRDGSAYLGTSSISIAKLPKKLQEALSGRTEKSVYLKADAHTPYASLVTVLDSFHRAGIQGMTLLTNQSGALASAFATPKGLPIRIVKPRAASTGE